jgi:hypothetical protein
MPPRWNAWTTLHAVRFDYEREPKPRQVRLSGPSIVVGEPVRVGLSGVEIEAIIVSVDQGELVVKVRRTPAKVESLKAPQRQSKASRKERDG